MSGISDEGINKLNEIKILNTSYNSKITNINHMKKLIKLYASGENCGISDKAIKNLKKFQILHTN
jgi:hypothetical protein